LRCCPGIGVDGSNIAAPNGLVLTFPGLGVLGVTVGSVGPAWLIWPGHGAAETDGTDEVGGGGGRSGLVRVSVVSSMPMSVSASFDVALSDLSYDLAVTRSDRAEAWVVVGAGSAGCVLANRLSADPDRSVTLIEAGSDLTTHDLDGPLGGPDFLGALDVPGRMYPSLLATRTTGGIPSLYRRGRGVGGSSAVNAMVALRGDPRLYRSWGWHDTDEAWKLVALPEEVAGDGELGPVDRALLASAPDAERAKLTRRDGRRVTSAEASLWPALGRANLAVYVESIVDRVVFDGRRAVGVALAGGDVIPADHVVLAAGAIHSPAILLRSEVDTAGVGSGLQDHPSAPLTLQLRDGCAGATGALAVGALVQRDPWQFLPMNHLGEAAPGFGLLMTALMRPEGRAGTVRLASDDPTIDPLVDFALLDDADDLASLVAGVRQALDLLDEPAFRDIVEETYIDEFGTTASTLTSDDSIERWVRSGVGDYVHASSSCAMGTVVDDNGQVFGYEALFVCDASVFPSIPDVNTHLPTTMLAERLSNRWLRPSSATRPSQR
jgi:choline dehydrogenase-like flavoprotein